MIKLYEEAKKLIPELKLEVRNNYAEIYFNSLKLFDTAGPNYQSQVEVFLGGLISGYNLSIAKSIQK